MSDQEARLERPVSRFARARNRETDRSRSSGLSAPLTSFVGRSREMAALTSRLAETRLLTLTGIGGIGKSRLALELARAVEGVAFAEVILVELAAVAQPNAVLPAVARALGVQEHGDRPLLDGMSTRIAGHVMLLILDNCEHLAEATAGLALDLMRRCPTLRVLATSRIPLDLPGEATWRVEPLAVPNLGSPLRLTTLARYSGVRLFADRARTAQASFRLTEQNAADVAWICARLDGIPLAIELAAARMNVLTPKQILERLDDRFQLLTSGSQVVLPRHRTLRAMIDWSHDLLDTRERMLFRRLATFAGGWTMEAAEIVCGTDGIDRDEVLDLLTGLVAKSLVLVNHQRSETRFGLLETIRAYALGRLREAGEEPQVCRRHVEWVLALVGRAETQLWTGEQRACLERLDDEVDNVRAALTWSTGHGDPEPGLRIAARLWRFWEQRGHSSEARRWLRTLLARSGTSSSQARAMALEASAYFAHLTGDIPSAEVFSQEALAMAREVGDAPALVCALLSRGILLGTAGDLAESEAALFEALTVAREAAWQPGVRMALLDLGVLARITGAVDRATAFLDEGRALSEAAGDSYTQGYYTITLAHLSLQLDDGDTAARQYRHALGIWRDLRDTHNVAMALEGLAWAVGMQGRAAPSVQLLGASEALRELVGTAILPHWKADHDHAREAGRAALGADPFAAAWAAGRSLTMEQALAYALTLTDDRHADRARPSISGDGTTRREPAGSQHAPLSQREMEVARLVAKGLTNRQIAEAQVLQPSTVGNHLQRIYARLDVNGRVQLAAWVSEHDPATDERSGYGDGTGISRD